MIELVNKTNIGEAPCRHLPDGNGNENADVNAFHHRFYPSTQSVAAEVVNAVATIKNDDETELEPLYEAIDPDALQSIVESSARRRGDVEIQFRYEGLAITIKSGGDIWLHWV